jgi:hypothetical protein
MNDRKSVKERVAALESDINDDLAMMLKYFTDMQNSQRRYEERHWSFSCKLDQLKRLAEASPDAIE